VVSGTCSGYPKPSWQSGVAGIRSDGVRDIPDISMFAGSGLWGHYYVICWSDVRNGGAPCTGAPSTWAGAGGTSFGAPIMAGIQALVNQHHGAQGNPNSVYYKLAANSANVCNSSGAIPSGCIFHNVTKADNDVNCGGSENCYGASSSGRGSGFGASMDGALSTSDQSFLPAYTASTGWNFATGLGTTNAYNLVMNWSSGQ
jgi:subtilase family serine protease